VSAAPVTSTAGGGPVGTTASTAGYPPGMPPLPAGAVLVYQPGIGWVVIKVY
jgi:hypothetical protein